MVVRFVKLGPLWAVLAGAGLLAMAGSAAQGQCPKPCCPPPPCYSPCPYPPSTQPPEQREPPTTEPPTREGEVTTPPGTESPFTAGASAATGTQTVALAAPNMMGDLLGAGKSIAFFYQRSSGSVFINGTGSTNVINPKVADNNSPLPEDRLAFRYNFFANSQAVTGDSGQTVFAPDLGLGRFSEPRFRGILKTRTYDVNDFTFSVEKTFGERLFSVELRVPFSQTLSHNLNLSVARVTSMGPDIDGDSTSAVLQTVATPQDTLGNSDTEFGNMAVILKGLAYQTKTLAVSLGASFGIPTGPNTNVRVIDFLGDAHDNDVEIQRQRVFHIENQTWAISPFLAFLATPSDRFFLQGFMQFDFPLNKSHISYSDAAVINTEPTELTFNPLYFTDRIREQTLMQLDLGTGFWLLHDATNPLITGIAPTLELHYTTTLNNADIRSLPLATKSPELQPVGPNGVTVLEPNPTVGNLRNRVDILDLTVGTTFEFSNKATMAFGFAFPLRGGDNKTFDWEFLLQLNYYFGGPPPPAPTFQ
jgi:hypothetical protein